MTERAGLHRILGNSRVYAVVQNGLVRMSTWDRVQQRFLPSLRAPGVRVLDIGCGPAEFLSNYPWFPADHYTGFDPNPAYIETAARQFPTAELHVGTTDTLSDTVTGTYDIAVAFSVLHHVDDHQAEAIAKFARERLRPGGLFMSMDPVLIDHQNPIARLLAKADRGQHVRRADGYGDAVAAAFTPEDVRVEVMSGLLRVPYNHCFVTATAR